MSYYLHGKQRVRLEIFYTLGYLYNKCLRVEISVQPTANFVIDKLAVPSQLCSSHLFSISLAPFTLPRNQGKYIPIRLRDVEEGLLGGAGPSPSLLQAWQVNNQLLKDGPAHRMKSIHGERRLSFRRQGSKKTSQVLPQQRTDDPRTDVVVAFVHAKSLQSCLTLCDPMDYSQPSSSVHGFPRQECWSGLPCHPPGDLPDPGMEPMSFMSPALAGKFFTTRGNWESQQQLETMINNKDKVYQ